MEEKFISITEASKLLSVHTQTIRNWIKKGVLISFRPNPRGKIFMRDADIRNLFKKEKE